MHPLRETAPAATGTVTWEGLNPPYATIVADPPWHYDSRLVRGNVRRAFPYSTMTVEEIAALPVRELQRYKAHLYLWTTNHYLRGAYDVAEAWGYADVTCLVWAKPPMGMGLGGSFCRTAEFVLFCRRGGLPTKTRQDSTWFQASRHGHSVKPRHLIDMVEAMSPGPYLELFARQPRLGWDAWGYGYEAAAAS